MPLRFPFPPKGPALSSPNEVSPRDGPSYTAPFEPAPSVLYDQSEPLDAPGPNEYSYRGPLSRRYLNVFVATLNRSRYLDPSKRCFLFVATPINSIYASCMNRTVSSNYKAAISHMPRPTRPMRWAEQLFVMISSKHCRRQSQRSRSRRRTLRSRTWWLRRRKKEEGKQGATSAEALESD